MNPNENKDDQMLLGLHTYSLYLDDGILESLESPFLAETVKQLKKAAPMAEGYGIRLALENHCDSFSEEIIWVLEEVNHPFVGACIDTMNALLP